VNIVVLDDEPSIVQMCVKVLQSQGHAVEGFTSAADALAHLERAAADLLVVDYKMPELTGIDFIKRAWSLRPDMRVVMITAHGTREVIARANETGVNVVLKPFTPGELTRGIAQALGGEELPRPDAAS
jgi:two-component system repressor protein LuxO